MIKKIVLLAVSWCVLNQAVGQTTLPVLRSTKDKLSIREDDNLNKDGWTISPELKPDIHTTNVTKKPVRVTFISDVDSISFTVKMGQVIDFWVLRETAKGIDSAWTQIKGDKYTPNAVYNQKYIKSHDNTTSTEIPEAYELVNIIISLAPKYKVRQRNAVERSSSYYADVDAHFSKYADEPIVKTFDSLLMIKWQWYFGLKTNGMCYQFKGNKLVPDPVYNRMWEMEANKQPLAPYIKDIEAFAAKTGFREFYKSHKNVYDDQVKAYRDSIDTKEMVSWLNRNFPATRWNSFKIIWSPLVGGNQNSHGFTYNGFREALVHVNFPYAHSSWFKAKSKTSFDLKRGNIVFTEINHDFINPEANQYSSQILTAFPDKYRWIVKNSTGENYGSNMGIFNEYMNWALVSLRYVDYAPAEEQEELIKENEEFMGEKGRGFRQFPEFDQFLVNLYKNRKPEQTLADLYPQIVDWFIAHK